MKGLELLYRGSLKSCNYQCSYCPFSKHRRSERELLKDRKQWEHFAETVRERAERLQIRSLLVVPYGEALIHPWYWEGLGRISSLHGIEAVGAQTNLSFPVLESLERFRKASGDIKKLHLWATFHPEMTSVEAFSETCRKLLEEGIRLCAGAVGVPQNGELLKRLRAELPKELYLWINRLDGQKRPYTQEETEMFLKIDPCFLRELADAPADPEQCRNRLFVEGNGKLRICNISRASGMSWDDLWELQREKEPCEDNGTLPDLLCGRRRCSCYLAYGGREHFMNQILFGPHPVFRVPRRAKAVFLDIMGTLVVRDVSGQERISGWTLAGLESLWRSGIPLFFATTLPYQEAQKRCKRIWHLFSGGIFAGGAHVVLKESVLERSCQEKGGRWKETGKAIGAEQERSRREQEENDGKWKRSGKKACGTREMVQTIEERCLSVLKRVRQDLQCRVLHYRTREGLYKVTLCRPTGRHWQEEEKESLSELLADAKICGIRLFAEDNCLQIVAEQATKAEGVRLICRELHIMPKEAAAAGDSAEDEEMLQICREKA